MRHSILISVIEKTKQESALQLLTQINGKTEFDYGSACGIIKGLMLAQEIIQKDVAASQQNGGQFDDN